MKMTRTMGLEETDTKKKINKKTNNNKDLNNRKTPECGQSRTN